MTLTRLPASETNTSPVVREGVASLMRTGPYMTHGLAPDLGGKPAADDGDEADREGEEPSPKKPARGLQPAASMISPSPPIAKRFALATSSGIASSTSVAGCWIFPARLGRRELRPLMFEHVQPRQAAEEELDRD
jgi:hypothetical protein